MVDDRLEYHLQLFDNAAKKFQESISASLNGNCSIKLFNVKKESSNLKFNKTSFLKKSNDSSYKFKASVRAQKTMKIEDLLTVASGNTFKSMTAKVLAINEKAVGTKSLKEIVLGDDTGHTTMTVWPEAYKEVSIIQVGNVLSLKSFSVSDYRMPNNGPKTLKYIPKKTKLTIVNDKEISSTFDAIKYENPNVEVSGKVVETMNTLLYLSCPRCRKKIDLESQNCLTDSCFWIVKENECTSDFKTTLVLAESNSEDYHYITCWRKDLADFVDESEEVLKKENEDDDEFIKKKIKKIMNVKVKIKYRKKEEFDGRFIHLIKEED